MWKGCLLLLAALAAALWLERQFLRPMDLPYSSVVVLVLAFSVATVCGGIQGVIQSFRTKFNPETHSNAWQDGQMVRVGGVIQASGSLLKAPFTGKDAVAVEFEMNATDRGLDESPDSPFAKKITPPSLRGINTVPFGLITLGGYVALSGVPYLRRFPSFNSADRSYHAQALHLLLGTKWQIANLALGESVFRQFGNLSRQDVRLYLVNRRAVEVLFTPPNQPVAGWLEEGPPPQLQGQQAAEALSIRLAQRQWQFYEFTLTPGTEVTVEGTFRANPRCIEIGRWMLDGSGMNAIQPGLAAKTASSQLWQAALFTIVGFVLTVALHYIAYADGGSIYMALLAWFESLPAS